MKAKPKPRLEYLDADIAAIVLANAEEHIPKLLSMIGAEPTKLTQTRHSSLASDYESVAYFSYALGLPLAGITEAFSKASLANLKVFELRGTEPRFPAFSFRFDSNYLADTPESSVEFRNLRENELDYSLTNSRKGYVAVCNALVACEDSLAMRIAELIWDPPNAAYIGPESFCTPDDQHLAYALRHLLGGGLVDMELGKIQVGRTAGSIGHQATMLRALAAKDADGFLEGVTGLLAWHEEQASSNRNRLDPEFFICTIGLGLCRLAQTNQVCSMDDFPQGNVFLPLEMIHSS